MKIENKMGTKTGKMGGKQGRESQEDSCKKDRMGGGNFAKQEYNSKLTLKNAKTEVDVIFSIFIGGLSNRT